ncbi:hypothetical protein CL176_04615 [Suicoccus acidiformans]|uniref:HTH gntR-type domain-containing protein n=1 Tax=Suicoccus acidiformans TaxID=2036206 RepID=A0A347WJT0_9LACT|nr:GntR family transcriptional regulator [Suicoccus acidiformans]AXY25337.1 hypothetical protein CL176_04615 [Suicoccus acidiformans]
MIEFNGYGLPKYIADKEFIIGVALNVNKLSGDLNVSRMPVKQAIEQLEEEGYGKWVGREYYVSDLSI